MLVEVGVCYGLVGYFECCQYYYESSELVVCKFVVVQYVGLVLVLCVGEILEQWEVGQIEMVIVSQLVLVLELVGVVGFVNVVVVYELVWVIGIGCIVSKEQVQQVYVFICGEVVCIDVRIVDLLFIVYGGSVKFDNVGELFVQLDVDGGLVGGVFLVVVDFLVIVWVVVVN